MTRSITHTSQRTALLLFFTVEVLGLTLMQKFVMPINLRPVGLNIDIGSIEAIIPITYIALSILFFFINPRISLSRLIFLVAFLSFSIFSTLMTTNTYSTNSIALLIVIYLPFIFIIEVSEHNYRSMLKIFLDAMIIFGAIALIQHVMQLVSSWRSWPNLNELIPDDFQYTHFNYVQPIKFGSRLMKPNGIVFLEVSLLSEWTAVAFGLELIYFRRFWRMLFYAIVLVATFAGTGLFMLLLSAPVLLTGISRKSLASVVVIFTAAVIFASQIHWNSQVNQRFTEYQMQETSSYKRFIEPFQILQTTLLHPGALVVGEGPGNGDKENGAAWWPITKICYEYGFLAGFAFLAFLSYVMLQGAPSQRIAFLLLVMFNFMAGAAIPVYPILLFVFGGLFRIRESKTNRRKVQGAPKPALASDAIAGASSWR
jgi:hypothetical protein